MKDKRILLIGGSGYIGSKFYSTFSSKYKIESIDLQLFNSSQYSKKINYNLIDTNNYECIICFAGHSSVNMCEYSSSRSWINNVEYFQNLCQKLNKDQKLIYMSSASVYGNTKNICSEDIDLNIKPVQHYDLHKILIDIIANKYILENKNIIGFRLGTVNGPSINTRSDLMLNSMVKNAIENKTIKIINKHIKRSILGINDLMRAIEITIDNKILSGQYNLASFTMTVEQLANTVRSIIDCNIIEDQCVNNNFYSFEISTNKFKELTNFIFDDNPISLIKQLINNHNYTNYSIRNTDADFTKYI